MEDPLQVNLGNRNSRVELIRHTSPPVTVRAYGNPAPPEDEQDDLATLLHYVGMLWKHKWILLFSATLGGLISFWVVLRTNPMYHAKTSLEIQRIPQPFGQPVVLETTTDTQIQILSSRTLKSRALKNVPYEPDGKEVETTGPLADIRRRLKLPDPASTIGYGLALSIASNTVSISKGKENSTILDIQADSTNPEAAANFVNSLASVFIAATQEQKWEAYENTGSWMKGEQERLRIDIETSERQLAKFAKEKGLIFTDSPAGTSGTQTVGEETLKVLQRNLLEAKNDQNTILSQHPANGDSAAVMDSNRLANLNSQIGDLEATKERLLITLTPKADKVMEIEAQIAKLQQFKQEELTTIELKSKKTIDSANDRVARLQTEFEKRSQEISKQSDDLIKYNVMKRYVDTNKSLYSTMLEQSTATSIASAMRNSSAHVVDSAIPLRSPVKPDLPFTLGMGLLGGLVCGAGFVIIRSRADLTVQAPGSLELSLNLRELGVIPSAKVDKQLRNVRAFRRLPAANGTPRTPGTVDCLEMAATSLTPSAMAEAFRSTMTSLLLSGEGGDPPKVLVFTSASPGEGKTTVVSNLAISLAQINQRVLLIDADMRLPRAHLIFDTPNNFGLSDVLNERKPIEEYVDESLVRKTHIPNLFILPAGPARTNLSRLFHSTRMNELLARFRDMFDVVLIDTAPVLVVPDSRILARRADAVVLVVRAHQTHQAAAFAASNRFASDGTRVLGTILNDWDPRSATHSYGGYYGKKGYSYYSEK